MKLSRLSLAALALGLPLSCLAVARGQGAPAPKPPEKPAEPGQPPKPGEPAPAEGTPGAEGARTVALSKFFELMKTEQWKAAEDAWNELGKEYPEYKANVHFLFRLAQCQFAQGNAKFDAAGQTLSSLLEKDPTHIQGLFLLARIRASSDKPQPKEEAKELLITAARNGLYVLREIYTNKEVQGTFQYLRDDPKFILRAMRESQNFQVGPALAKARNPFQTPWRDFVRDGGSDKPGGAINVQKMQELESKITKIFEDIERLAKEQKVDELIPKFAELNQCMNEYGNAGLDKAKEKLKQWEKKLEEFKEIRLAIKLQIYINQGNQLLQAMAKAIAVEKFEEVFERFANLKGVVEDMKREERDEFHRNGDALYSRGKTLDDEAHKLKKIKDFNLVVTGIVIDPRPDSKDRAIINNKIYEVGDPVTDANDNEILGLRVVKINEGSVKFRYEDTEFFRQLKTQ